MYSTFSLSENVAQGPGLIRTTCLVSEPTYGPEKAEHKDASSQREVYGMRLVNKRTTSTYVNLKDQWGYLS